LSIEAVEKGNMGYSLLFTLKSEHLKGSGTARYW